MKPRKLVRYLTKLVLAGAPVLLTGAPGIGKSDIAEQVRKNLGYDMVLTHAVVKDTTDAKGLPWPNIEKGIAEFLPFGDIQKIMSATRPTIWFLDDLGQALPSVQASFMQLLLAREIDGKRIPDCVTFIAATNRKQDRAGVSGILEPVKSRFVTIINVEVSVEDWCSWALSKGYSPKLVAFIRWKNVSDNTILHHFEPTAEMTNSRSPRTWAHVGDLMKIDFNDEDLGEPEYEDMLELYSGAVGQAGALEFMKFLNLIDKCPHPSTILLSPDSAVIPDSMDILWNLVVGIATLVTPENFYRLTLYAKRLWDKGQSELTSVMMKDAVRLHPEVTNTPEFTSFLTSDFGKKVMA